MIQWAYVIVGEVKPLTQPKPNYEVINGEGKKKITDRID